MPQVLFYIGWSVISNADKLIYAASPVDIDTIDNTMIPVSEMPTVYTQYWGLGHRESNLYGKRSDDGKTISWYSTQETYGASYQLNNANQTYYFLAIG